MKTSLRIVLLAALSISLITGCGSENDSSELVSTGESSTNESTTPEQEANGGDSNSTEDPPPGPDTSVLSTSVTACGDDYSATPQIQADAFVALHSRVESALISATFAEATTGTLSLGLNPATLNVLNTDKGPVIAASTLGQGRVLVYSGQDFLSSHDRSTLLGNVHLDTMLLNGIQWVANRSAVSTINVLSDSDTLTASIADPQLSVTTAAISSPAGLREYRDWSSSALAGRDVLLVQVNEWGTLHLDPTHIADIREFVSAGGGLILTGSALHWSWWLSDSADAFPGNLLLQDTGIQFNVNNINSFSSTTMEFDADTRPLKLWCDYIDAQAIQPASLQSLTGAFSAAQKAGFDGDMQVALERLVNETPSLPVSTTSPQAVLSAAVASELSPLQWPSVHPWAAALADGYKDSLVSRKSVLVNGAYSGNQPTGLYAPPGNIVTVTVPDSLIGIGARIQVGEQLDDLTASNATTNGSWRRAPAVVKHFPIDGNIVEIGNAYGGSIYLNLPAATGSTLELLVSGALPMPVYTHNETTPESWQASIDTTYAPDSILQQRGHVRLVVSTTEARTVSAPGDVMAFWTGFHQHHAELASEPQARNFESHWLFDEQVGYGYANATPARIVYPKIAEQWALRTRTGDEDWWLFGHELGHQFQTSDWSGGDITEVAVNLFTMYTLNDYIFSGAGNQSIGASPENIDHAALIGSDWINADLFGKLQLYRQLVDVFGWEVFKATFASYYDNAYPRETYGSFMDGFAIRFSVAVQRDLAEFLRRWNYPVSASALSTIGGFNYPLWLPPGW